MLRAEGHDVLTATSGEDGIESARRLQPDIIIMDVVMPGLNGFEATRLLARENATAGIPVIILSTRQSESDRLWGLRQGAHDYLSKPVSKQALLSSVDAALEKA